MAITKRIYDFTLPLTKEAIKWRFLSVGEESDLVAAYNDQASRHLLSLAITAARIVSKDPAKKVEIQDVREWDGLDLEAFIDHVQEVQDTRVASLQKPDAGSLAPLEDSWRAFRKSINEVLSNGEKLMVAMRAAKVAPGPLASSPGA